MLDFDRYRAELTAQTDLLRALAANGDLRARVPSCPDWNLAQLLGHVGGTHRWTETIVRTRATEPVSDHLTNDVAEYTDEEAGFLDGWLAEGAALLTEALRDAGPDAEVWTVAPGEVPGAGSPLFWARRMTHETVVHRADVALTVGAEYTLAADVARDALDEWMTFAALEEAYGPRPDLPDLLGPGRTLHFHATDAADAEWLVDLTGDAPVWRHAHEKAAVAVRGPLADLLLAVYARPTGDRVEILGDADLFELWRRRAGFWLEADDADDAHDTGD